MSPQEISDTSTSTPRTSIDQSSHRIYCDPPDTQALSPTHQAASMSSFDHPDGGRGSSSTSTDSTPELALPILESLGFSGLSSLIGGHIGILGALAFLAFLWFGFGAAPEAAKATSAWRRIALSDWMTRAITLSSLAIRVLTTLQVTVCTSMIAALILERRRARKSYVPWLSVIRSINDGPLRLLQMLLASMDFAVVCYPEFGLAVLMVSITLVLQLSSTLLLSDLHSFVIVGDYNRSQVPSLIPYNASTFDIHIDGFKYLLRSPIFSTFGEVQSVFDSSPNSHGLSDTGLLQRGFLPFAESQNRTSTRHYEGNAIVMSSRVACMRPVILGEYGYISNEYKNFPGCGVLEGMIQYTSSFRKAHVTSIPPCESGDCEEEPFRCHIPSSNFGDWQSAACKLGGFGTAAGILTLEPKWTPSDKPWTANSSTYLLQTTNMRDKDWSQVPDTQELPEGVPFEEWQSYEIFPGRFLNITLCYMGVALERKAVEMDSSGGLREPVITGSQISTEYNTTDVQTLFGVDDPRKSVAERGILNMTILGEPQDGPHSSQAYDTVNIEDGKNITTARFTPAILELVLSAQAIEVGSNTTLPFCGLCSIIIEATTPDTSIQLMEFNLMLILRDITTQSRRAVDALSTYLTIMASAVYYDYLGAFLGFQEAGTVLTTSVLVPGPCSEHGCRGFISVAVLLGVHIIYVTIITLLYIRQARYSRYSNIWHTTSQLVTGELKKAWKHSINKSDSAVTKAFIEDGEDDFLMLGQIDAEGQIGFLKTNMPIKQTQGSGASLANPNWKNRLAWLRGKLPGKSGKS
ncbi:hypothetical protein F5Y10DRAFT_294547 [Nemania abortiva]|nr:hypothetical protein F5Y10DRAFT_294547 [Nemania abortiva]